MSYSLYDSDCVIPRYGTASPLEILLEFAIDGPFYHFVVLLWLLGGALLLFAASRGDGVKRQYLFLPGLAAFLQMVRVGLAAFVLCSMDLEKLNYIVSALLASCIGSILMLLPLLAIAATIQPIHISSRFKSCEGLLCATFIGVSSATITFFGIWPVLALLGSIVSALLLFFVQRTLPTEAQRMAHARWFSLFGLAVYISWSGLLQLM